MSGGSGQLAAGSNQLQQMPAASNQGQQMQKPQMGQIPFQGGMFGGGQQNPFTGSFAQGIPSGFPMQTAQTVAVGQPMPQRYDGVGNGFDGGGYQTDPAMLQQLAQGFQDGRTSIPKFANQQAYDQFMAGGGGGMQPSMGIAGLTGQMPPPFIGQPYQQGNDQVDMRPTNMTQKSSLSAMPAYRPTMGSIDGRKLRDMMDITKRREVGDSNMQLPSSIENNLPPSLKRPTQGINRGYK